MYLYVDMYICIHIYTYTYCCSAPDPLKPQNNHFWTEVGSSSVVEG